MVAIEKENSQLKGVLPKEYARPALHKQRLGELIDPHLQSSRSVSLIQGPSGKSPLQTLVSPSIRKDVFFGRQANALMFVHDPEKQERPHSETLRILYGLTASEAQVAALLAPRCSFVLDDFFIFSLSYVFSGQV